MTKAALLLLPVAMTFMAGQVRADDACPQMSGADIDAQWHDYASRSGGRPVDFGSQYDCITFQAVEPPLVCRTKAEHPAHPSIVVVKVFMSGGSVELRPDGHTAGNCDAFKTMMLQFRALNRSMQGRDNNGLPIRP